MKRFSLCAVHHAVCICTERTPIVQDRTTYCLPRRLLVERIGSLFVLYGRLSFQAVISDVNRGSSVGCVNVDSEAKLSNRGGCPVLKSEKWGANDRARSGEEVVPFNKPQHRA